MRLEQLKYVMAIYEHKSINKAAQKLFISPQALCFALNSLENELGFSIFARTSKGVALTYHGDKIIEDIENVTKTIDNWQTLMRTDYEMASEIYISTAMVCATVLTKNIVNIKSVYPNATIFLKALDPKSIFDMKDISLKDSILLTAMPSTLVPQAFETLRTKGYLAFEIGYDVECLIVSENSPLAKKESVAYDELYDFELAIYQPTTAGKTAGVNFSKYFRHGASYIFNDKTQQQKFVAKNNAVSTMVNLDRYDNYYFESGKLQMIPFTEAPPMLTYILSYPDKTHKTAAEEFIIERIRHDFLQLQAEGFVL